MQVGLWAISELSGGGGAQGERPRRHGQGSDSEEAGPARHPGGDGRRPQQARHSSGAMACKEAQELHGLAAKPAADDNQAAASGVAKFGVRLMPLAACRICHRAARLDVSARVCLTKTCEGGSNSGIDGELGSMPKREAVRDNLNALLIGDGHVEVYVGEADVASNSCPGLPATGSVSHQDAQCAAWPSEEAERRPSPPKRWGSGAARSPASGRGALPCSNSTARHRATATSCATA